MHLSVARQPLAKPFSVAERALRWVWCRRLSVATAVGPRLRGKGKQQALPLLLSLGNNQLEQHDVLIRQPKKSEEDPSRRSGGVHLAGHRADVRAVALSSDDELLLSTSHAEIKLWNLRSQACIRTIPTVVVCAPLCLVLWLSKFRESHNRSDTDDVVATGTVRHPRERVGDVDAILLRGT
eukprot:COSAG01_NODE_5084_length_4499_cov_2.262045_4_plen_180_part_01